MHHSQRRDVARRKMAEAGIGVAALVPGPNLLYLSGLKMSMSERFTALILKAGSGENTQTETEEVFVCPQLEAGKIEDITGLQAIAYSDQDGPAEAVAAAMSALGFQRQTQQQNPLIVGAEHRYMRLMDWEILRQVAGDSYTDLDGIVGAMRLRKSSEEASRLKAAAELVQLGIQAIEDNLRPGLTETKLAEMAVEAMRQHNPSTEAHISLASGPRSAFPHAATSDRTIEAGDALWADIVASSDHYWGDITRTFTVGRIDPHLKEAYEVVYQAQKKARESVHQGMTGEEVDALCRDLIDAEGFGEFFTHRTGHGLGLEVHEAPYMVKGNSQRLEAGMAFTIEPGVYLPGIGGVRIEDDILITEEGAVSLTDYKRKIFL